MWKKAQKNNHTDFETSYSSSREDDEKVELQGFQSDEEELVRRASESNPSPCVEYHIVYSPSYRVPILHFAFHNLPPLLKASDLDTVYALLVPGEYQEALEGCNIVGGVSRGVCMLIT
jgi:hypothetical protein